MSGTIVGGKISKSPLAVQKYTAGGLIPQGGIVIGLALVIRQNASFNLLSDIILNVIIGATIIHEIIGPLISKFTLEKAGEIKSDKKVHWSSKEFQNKIYGFKLKNPKSFKIPIPLKGQLGLFDVKIPKIKNKNIITDIIDEEYRYQWIGHH